MRATPGPAAAKRSLRTTMKSLRDNIAPARAHRAAQRAAQCALTVPEIRSATVVALYASLSSELSTHPLATALTGRGATVVYPRMHSQSRTLTFHRITPQAPFQQNAFGIREPSAEAPQVHPNSIDFVFVPAIAFDVFGQRLGWGFGYYDRFLTRTNALSVGFAHECQLIDAVPTMCHDVAMHMIVTDQRVRRIHEERNASGQLRLEP